VRTFARLLVGVLEKNKITNFIDIWLMWDLRIEKQKN